jgi:hypothetical protein
VWTLFEPGNGSDRASGSALDLQREADEPEPSLADELVEINQPLHVGETHVTTDVVHLEVVASGTAGLTASTPNIVIPLFPSQVADSLVGQGNR